MVMMCNVTQLQLEHVLKLFGELLQVSHSCTELRYKSISKGQYLQLLPELSINGDIPPLLLRVFMVCTRIALPFSTCSRVSNFSFTFEGYVTL